VLASLAAFVLLIIVFVIQLFSSLNADAEEKGPVALIFAELPAFANFAVVLLIVSVPEGLPLTIGVALAFSVMKM